MESITISLEENKGNDDKRELELTKRYLEFNKINTQLSYLKFRQIRNFN